MAESTVISIAGDSTSDFDKYLDPSYPSYSITNSIGEPTGDSISLSSIDIGNMNETTKKQLKDRIAQVVKDLRTEYIKNKKYISDSSFKKNAQRIVDQTLANYKTILNKDTALKSEINSYVTKTIDENLQIYKEDVISSKAGTLKSTEDSINKGKLGEFSYDYDPIVEDGKSYIVVSKTSTDTMADGSKKTSQKIENKVPASIYHSTNNSYSGADMVCTIRFRTNSGKEIHSALGTLQTISYSIYQQKQPVRVLGNMNAKDWVFGPRTIAGSLVFAVFNTHWLIDLYEQLYYDADMKGWHFIADEIPPFDITITFANEYGFDSKMVIYGVRLMNEGQTMSTNDIYIENTYQFVANDINLMDELSAYQRGESKIHDAVGIVTVQNAKMKDRPVYVPQDNKTEKNNGGNNSSGDKKETIEDAVNSLKYTQDMWNSEVLKQNMDLDKAKKAAKKSIEDQYEELKKKFTSKEDQNKLKESYKTAIESIDDFYAKTKNGEIKISAEYSQAKYPEQIKLFLGYSETKYNEFFVEGGTSEKAIELYKKYLNEQLNKIKQRVETKIYTQKDLAYANSVYNETCGILDNKARDPGQDEKNKSEIDLMFVVTEDIWKRYKENHKNDKINPLHNAYQDLIKQYESIYEDIKTKPIYNAKDREYAESKYQETLNTIKQWYDHDNEQF